MPYMSPADAFSSSIESYMMQKAAMQRQAQMDQLTRDREARLAEHDRIEMENAKLALQRQRDVANQQIEDKQRAAFDKRVHDMMPGDIPDAGLLALDDKFGTGYFSPDEKTGHRIYKGTKGDREAAARRQKVEEAQRSMMAAQPGTPEYQQALVNYGMALEKPLTAAEVGGLRGAKSDSIPLIRMSPDKRIAQRLVNGQWVDLTGDAPPTSHFFQEQPPKDTSARDAAASNHVDTVRQQAYTELDKWGTPILGQLDGLNKLGIALEQKTPQADALIAPLVLKATIAGQGSGFRMTRAEIDNVMHSRSKWQNLEAALKQWETDPSKALQVTDEQRQQLRELAKAIRKKAYGLTKSIMEARHNITNAEDVKSINQHRDRVHDAIMAMDEEDDDQQGQGNTGGLPTVGSVFNGGKVLKVTKIGGK